MISISVCIFSSSYVYLGLLDLYYVRLFDEIIVVSDWLNVYIRKIDAEIRISIIGLTEADDLFMHFTELSLL